MYTGRWRTCFPCWIWPTPTVCTSSRMPRRHMALPTPAPLPSESMPAMQAVWGDLGRFSLNGVKNMGGLGDGGMVTVSSRLLARDRAVADRLRGLRDLGRYANARYLHDDWGLRARMDEFMAAQCLLELAELDAWNARRRAIAPRYRAPLANSVVRAPVTAA